MHFSLILLVPDTDSRNYDRIIEDAMAPFKEEWEEDDPHTVMVIEDGEVYWQNPNAQWDWYQFGGRWYGLIEAKRGVHGERSWTNADMRPEPGRYDAALVRYITNIDANLVHAVLTPDGVWHDRETYHSELFDFVEDETFVTDFKRRFLDPYMDCRAFVIDYHC